MVYLCSSPYDPGAEHGVHPLDPDIGITWPDSARRILSGKDAAAPGLEQALAAGLLPSYQACLAHTPRCGRNQGFDVLPVAVRHDRRRWRAAPGPGHPRSPMGATPVRAQASCPSTLHAGRAAGRG